MKTAQLVIASFVFFAATSAFAQTPDAPNAHPTAVAPPKYTPTPPSANPADTPASTGTQGGELGASGGKDIPAGGTGVEVGPSR